MRQRLALTRTYAVACITYEPTVDTVATAD